MQPAVVGEKYTPGDEGGGGPVFLRQGAVHTVPKRHMYRKIVAPQARRTSKKKQLDTPFLRFDMMLDPFSRPCSSLHMCGQLRCIREMSVLRVWLDRFCTRESRFPAVWGLVVAQS